MKIKEILTEATDISDFGRSVLREAIPKADAELRRHFGYFRRRITPEILLEGLMMLLSMNILNPNTNIHPKMNTHIRG